jgi:hypothetical protein
MFTHLLCQHNNSCPQTTVYLVAQSVWVLTYAALLVSFSQKNLLNSTMLMSFVGMIVIMVIFYYLLEWLCSKNYDIIAWIVAMLPFITAIVWGYYLVPVVIQAKVAQMQQIQQMQQM